MSEVGVDTGQQEVRESSVGSEIHSELKGSDILSENDRTEADSGIGSDQADSTGSKSDHLNNQTNFSPDSDAQDKLTETSDNSECQESLPNDMETTRSTQQNEDSPAKKSDEEPSQTPEGDTVQQNGETSVGEENHHSKQNQAIENNSTPDQSEVSSAYTTEPVDKTSTNDNLTNSSEKPSEINSDSVPPTSKSNEVEKDHKTESIEENASPAASESAPAKEGESESIEGPAEGESEGGAAAASTSGEAKVNDKSPGQSVYHVKWIRFKNNTVPIVTQNENGPCPLLAIMNVLLLKGLVKFPSMIEMVTSGQLMDYLADCIFEHVPKDISDATRLNYEQNMIDAMAVFDKLQTGLDVNVRFTGVADFEYTRECIVFDLLSVPLYHGWLVDPEDPGMLASIGSLSYNQLVEKIISHKHSTDESLVREALIAEEFLERTASQLTYHGLSELASTVKEEQLCVFFRNNHFSTVYRFKNELFLLVTDQGFLTEPNVIWETLSNVEGDGHFVDADFRTYTKPEPVSTPVPDLELGSDQQIDHDYLVALSLQEEQQVTQADVSGAMGWQATVPTATLSDHELAMQLQDEENRRAAAAQQQQQQQQQQQPAQSRQPPRQQTSQTSTNSNGKQKKSDCTIL